MKCAASCACGGQLAAIFCPMLPGCDVCTHIHIHVVRFTPVYLDPDETLNQRIRRDDMISQMPEQYRQSSRMN